MISEDAPNDFIPLDSDSRLVISANGSVVIRSSDPLHEGLYSCNAENSIGKVLSKVVNLKVNGKFIIRNFNSITVLDSRVHHSFLLNLYQDPILLADVVNVWSDFIHLGTKKKKKNWVALQFYFTRYCTCSYIFLT